MKTGRTYVIRQRILGVARDLNPAPIGMDDLEASPAIAIVRPTREELVAEYNYLITQAFLTAIAETNGECARISAEGLDQINQETTRDHRIWGKMGL